MLSTLSTSITQPLSEICGCHVVRGGVRLTDAHSRVQAPGSTLLPTSCRLHGRLCVIPGRRILIHGRLTSAFARITSALTAATPRRNSFKTNHRVPSAEIGPLTQRPRPEPAKIEDWSHA